MSWKDAEPDIVQSLRNMRDKLSELLTIELGNEWGVRAGETPAMYAHRYLTHIGSKSASPQVTIPAGETVSIRVGIDPEPPQTQADVLAHAIRELYVRRKIFHLASLHESEHRAWQKVIGALGEAIRCSEEAMKDRSFIASELGRIPFMTEMSALREMLSQQFPNDAGSSGESEIEDPQAYGRLIAHAAERELHRAFGVAEISRMVLDGLPPELRKAEDRLRKRFKDHAENKTSEVPQTGKAWVVIIDDQE